MARTRLKNHKPYDTEWSQEAVQMCIQLYDEQSLPVDKLPYTGEFNHLWHALNARVKQNFSKHHTFQELMRLRKRAAPPKLEVKTEYDEITGTRLVVPKPTWWE